MARRRPGVRVEGLDRLLEKFRALPEDMAAAMRLEVKRSALAVQSGARRRAPVDTGRLRNSITHELAPDELSARIGTNVHYAPFQEFGTRRHAARPFLFPALEAERQRFTKRVEKALKAAAAKRARG